MTDLILSVVKGVQWESVDCYAISLKRSGYKGHAVMIAIESNLPVDKLKELGVEVIQMPNPGIKLHFQTWRYMVARDWLQQHVGEFRFVLWTDVWDLVFQSDPMEFMEKNRYRGQIVAAKEGRLIKNEGINTVWMERLCSGNVFQNNINQEVLCSGTIGGDAHNILALFNQMIAKMGRNDMQGIDQGIFNLVIRESFLPLTYIPEMNEGFISTCGMFLSANNPPEVWTVEHPYFDRETEPGTVWTNDHSKKFAIQHCYNRHHGLYDPNGDWRRIVEARYRG